MKSLFFIFFSIFSFSQATLASSMELKFSENPVEIAAAFQIAEKNQDQIYTDPTPPILYAIPIYKIFADSNGYIQKIEVLRYPSNPDAQHTVQMGIEAIKKAEPFINLVEHNHPVVFVQTFLFRDDLKFKLRVMDK